ncbi:hemerythrin domain-containing protein [Dehalogenimonas etheniformans]|uniref:Hemerythrin n=1 Tax=Dehalogenimonas etheniformans TaxID=1536648 RepID=A0A2P5P9Y2_9CHLR|nr:hemerythrin domain-containing protein [Dehalogenimonas etheniformans]PPD59101.1 hemerythrin [Dehalogenimonas etheniformans]QNT76781.1 hemerythrin domain-containing protein [Dehalogenimonas etheniformans]
MNPTDQLREEHGAILELLSVMDNISQRLNTNEAVDQEDLESIVDFIRIFADKCHHGKEEGLLFPAMEAAGMEGEYGPIAVMLSDHEQGRKYVGELAHGVETYSSDNNNAPMTIIGAISSYTNLLRQHIYKENNILFPMADRLLSPEKQQVLMDGFEELEERVIGLGKHEELHKTLHNLKKAYD